MSEVYFGPVGAGLDELTPMGYLSEDGLTLSTEDQEFWDAGLMYETSVSRNFNFEVKVLRWDRLIAALTFGIYRFPGDKPLIHKGGKP